MKWDVAESADWHALKEWIRAQASALGIDRIGFASAAPFHELKLRLQESKDNGWASGFEEPDIDKRVYPDRIFAAPKSLLSIVVAYPSKMQDPPRSGPGAYRGIIARSAWGMDYHHVLRNRLERLEQLIMENVAGARVDTMVDTGALSDRAVAERAGVGWSAKNCMIINDDLGSWIFLGDMITNIPFPPDQSVTSQCGDCTLCIDSCPTGALVGPGRLNAQRCVSFLTQTKGIIPDEFKKKIGNRIYGCDTCQIVCPKNKGKNWTHHEEFTPDPELVKPLLIPLLELSNKGFKAKYGHSSSAWRGKNPLQRNAVIALGHFREKAAIEVLGTMLLQDNRVPVREAAAWALGQMREEEAEQWLWRAREKEADTEVCEAIERALTTSTSEQPIKGGRS